MAHADSFTKQARANAGFVRRYSLLRDADQVDGTGPDSRRLELLEQRDDGTGTLRVVDIWDQPGNPHSAQRLLPITASPSARIIRAREPRFGEDDRMLQASRSKVWIKISGQSGGRQNGCC